MTTGIDLSKNIGLTSRDEVRSVCAPLYNHLDMNYFNYVKVNKDGSRCTITDRPDFIETYYKSPELFSTNCVVKMENFSGNSYFLSSQFNDQASYIVAREIYNISNGITIVLNNNESTELFYFGTKKENANHSLIYKNNLDLLYQFIFYFKENAATLIKQADSESFLIVPNSTSVSVEDFNDWNNYKSLKNDFLKDTPINFVEITISGKCNKLSMRELEIICYTLKNLSSKQVALLVGLSPRTVEFYISVIVKKFGLGSKQFFYKFLENGYVLLILHHNLFNQQHETD